MLLGCLLVVGVSHSYPRDSGLAHFGLGPSSATLPSSSSSNYADSSSKPKGKTISALKQTYTEVTDDEVNESDPGYNYQAPQRVPFSSTYSERTPYESLETHGAYSYDSQNRKKNFVHKVSTIRKLLYTYHKFKTYYSPIEKIYM